MAIALRPATREDAGEIGALFSASLRLLTFLPELHSIEDDLGHIRDDILVNCRVTVAVGDGRIVGFMAEEGSEIRHLYVAAGELRAGIGSALIADAQARHAALELWCFAANRRARRFYETRGFAPVRFTDGAGNEAKMPDVRYRWMRR
jgi:GNAT superfamily N-acetyltransferase